MQEDSITVSLLRCGAVMVLLLIWIVAATLLARAAYHMLIQFGLWLDRWH